MPNPLEFANKILSGVSLISSNIVKLFIIDKQYWHTVNIKEPMT